ncbi:MAG: hypothetical protein J3K34DRAFT_418160 [Monoraphidium minutum]|nr:MAG: hypothetical protein J3K34DRAFT_418160 [Monoraphidium minutum]
MAAAMGARPSCGTGGAPPPPLQATTQHCSGRRRPSQRRRARDPARRLVSMRYPLERSGHPHPFECKAPPRNTPRAAPSRPRPLALAPRGCIGCAARSGAPCRARAAAARRPPQCRAPLPAPRPRGRARPRGRRRRARPCRAPGHGPFGPAGFHPCLCRIWRAAPRAPTRRVRAPSRTAAPRGMAAAPLMLRERAAPPWGARSRLGGVLAGGASGGRVRSTRAAARACVPLGGLKVWREEHFRRTPRTLMRAPQDVHTSAWLRRAARARARVRTRDKSHGGASPAGPRPRAVAPRPHKMQGGTDGGNAAGWDGARERLKTAFPARAGSPPGPRPRGARPRPTAPPGAAAL